MLSLTENTQRYKSLAGFAIFPSGAIFAYSKRYALRGVRGFISYHTEHSEAYRNRVKRGYIAFAQRIYRKAEKERTFRLLNRFVLSFCRYKGLGLAHNAFDRSNAMLALSGVFKFSVKNITHLFAVPFVDVRSPCGERFEGSARGTLGKAPLASRLPPRSRAKNTALNPAARRRRASGKSRRAGRRLRRARSRAREFRGSFRR